MIFILLKNELLKRSRKTILSSEDLHQYQKFINLDIQEYILQNLYLDDNFFAMDLNFCSYDKLKEYAKFLIHVFLIFKSCGLHNSADLVYIYQQQYEIHTNLNLEFLNKKFYI